MKGKCIGDILDIGEVETNEGRTVRESLMMESPLTLSGSPVKESPWTPDRNPFCCFVAALPQVEDRDWVGNIYSIWTLTMQRATKLRSPRLVLMFANIKRVKQL